MMDSLPTAHQHTLDSFIKAFLPPRGNKRKTTRNELQRVHLTLHRVLQKYFGFGVTQQQVLTAFERLGYAIFAKKGEWNPDKKDWAPSAKGEITRAGGPYEEYSAGFLYVDVEAASIAQLWLATTTLPADASSEKAHQRELLVERIHAFKQIISRA
ncbi:hypothetical protein [Hymenobacter daeguensis]